MSEEMKKKIEDIIKLVLNYFKEIFAFWYPEEAEEVDEIIDEIKNA